MAFFLAPFLPLLGFGEGGVVAGSLAAGTQAGIGNVAAGSTFATLQSMGAAGIGTKALVATGAVVGAGVTAAVAPHIAGAHAVCLVAAHAVKLAGHAMAGHATAGHAMAGHAKMAGHTNVKLAGHAMALP